MNDETLDYRTAPAILHLGIWKYHLQLHWTNIKGIDSGYNRKNFFTAFLWVGPLCLTLLIAP